MKKFFLLFALLSCASFNDAFAVSMPDPCDPNANGYSVPEALCYNCLTYFDALRRYRMDTGCVGNGMCETVPGWNDIVANHKTALEFDVSVIPCLEPLFDDFDNLVYTVTWTETLNVDYCISRGFCECMSNYYADKNIVDEFYGSQDFYCLECPDSGVGAGGVLPITQCYLPAGTGDSDTTGTWQYSQNCYYTK